MDYVTMSPGADVRLLLDIMRVVRNAKRDFSNAR